MAHDPLSILNASPAPSTPQKPHLSSFYYGFVAIAAMVVILMAYNFLVVGCCWQSRSGRFERPPRREASHGPDTSIQMLVPVSKYRKKETEMQASNDECSVCLSLFTDGEDIRQLPECKHSFHADCIDMWLYSHSNCPLCRAHVAGEHRRRRVSEAAAAVAADSQQGLPDASSMA